MDSDFESKSSCSLPSEEQLYDDRRPLVEKAYGHYIYLEDGRKILDACGGAAVSCLGHGNREVLRAMDHQGQKVSYVAWAFFDNDSTRNLSEWLIRSTGGKMRKVYLTSSGSEAMDGAMKLAREYFVWKNEPQRVNFIARQDSYHGATIGPLSLGGHYTRRAPFLPMLSNNVAHISACNSYRQRLPGESDAEFVARKAQELHQAFLKLGPSTVCAFVAEPVVGAALGCMPTVPGYLKAMKAVCDDFGALLILDEVMCGMGRTGSQHAWQQEDVTPDIQTIGKCLGGGFQPCSAILAGSRIVDEMHKGRLTFTHGHTYQNHPIAAVAAFTVQKIIERENLITNVGNRGQQLEALLRARLETHPHVGNIRGRGLFWGIEFVRDKSTKEPFAVNLQIARRIHDLAISCQFELLIYYGQGCAGQGKGDHIMVCPAYNVTEDIIDNMVEKLVSVIETFFGTL